MSRAWDAEVDVTVELAATQIEQQFPALRPVRAEILGYGWDNVAFRVNGEYVFRLPRRSIGATVMRNELAALPRIAPLLSTPIPAPLFVGAPSTSYPWPFAGYALLPGVGFDGRRPSLDERVRLAPQLGAFLRRLHGVACRAATTGTLVGDEIGRLDHAKRLPQARARFAVIEAAGIVNDTAAFVTAMERIAPGPSPLAPAVVHGDLYARHLLVDDAGELTGVIDWGDVHLGDPALDLAAAKLVLPVRALDAFLTAYGPVDAVTWERATYRAVHHAALELAYGLDRSDCDLIDAAVFALGALREQI